MTGSFYGFIAIIDKAERNYLLNCWLSVQEAIQFQRSDAPSPSPSRLLAAGGQVLEMQPHEPAQTAKNDLNIVGGASQHRANFQEIPETIVLETNVSEEQALIVTVFLAFLSPVSFTYKCL